MIFSSRAAGMSEALSYACMRERQISTNSISLVLRGYLMHDNALTSLGTLCTNSGLGFVPFVNPVSWSERVAILGRGPVPCEIITKRFIPFMCILICHGNEYA